MNNSTPLAIIVGAGPGLGSALAKRFSSGNFKVALISRDKKRLLPFAEEIKHQGGQAFAYEADITNEKEVVSIFTEINQQLGSAQVLIYNPASKFEFKAISDILPEDFMDNWKVSCYGALLTAQQVLPAMKAQKRGTIIFTGATASLRSNANLASFSAGKFALRALAQSMAREYGPDGVHISHVIIDGQIATPAVLQYFPNRPLNTFLNPSAIAENYWQLHLQDPTTWTFELDLRPSVEKF